MFEVGRLLESIIKVSEKSANIARVCRQNDHLFKLLVQEKLEDEKNPRFIRDFKTLADVLIQETIKHDIGNEIPELAGNVNGEENNTFSNTLGESVTVEVCQSFEDTAKLLEKVLNNDSKAARLLAEEVHRDVIKTADITGEYNVPEDLKINVSELGIWIDPIDSTAEYITGIEKIDRSTGIHVTGLRCVTVLIGVFDKKSGRPILGVVNQPFYENNDSVWKGNVYWGLNCDGVKLSSLKSFERRNENLIILSSSEGSEIRKKLLENGFNVLEAAGAGYKLLTVILGQVDAYILSNGSTFRWDTCAPQAILDSLKGGVVDYNDFVKIQSTENSSLKYLSDDKDYCNRGGLVAYCDAKILETLKDILSEYN